MIFDLSKPNDCGKARNEIECFINDEKKIEIKEYKPKRTNLQNRYYRAIIRCIADYTGSNHEQVHKRFAKEFLSIDLEYRETDAFDTWLKSEPYTLSTTEINTKEMNLYIGEINKFVIDFFEGQLIIPKPEDKDFEQFLNHYEKMI